MIGPHFLQGIISRSASMMAAAAILIALTPVIGASAYTLKTLHSFCNEANCGDGDTPRNDLVMDASGNLFGTTQVGGAHGGGEVFKMRPVANGWAFGVIHSFCSQPPDCPDGDVPTATLAYAGQASGAPWDESSPLFGTANLGGANNKGIAYKLSPNGSGWTYQVLHGFSSSTKSAYPGPLVVDPSGNLFGVTYMGAKYGAGALYRLAAGTWKETTLHNFCAEPNCADGNGGFGRLAIDAAGNLFGTAFEGGSGSNCQEPSGCGVVFERTAGSKYKVIYDFCSKTNCKDGTEPAAGLNLDAGGTLFGTTHIGGTGNLGVVFTLSHASGWTEQTLYDFCSEQNCTDGAGPSALVILDNKGNVYGTASEDGANGSGGTVFSLKP